MNVKDIYWLAGYLDGEAYFGEIRRIPRIVVSATDLDVLQNAARVLGAGEPKPLPRYVPRYKPQWRVTVSGPRAAGWMLILYPLLCRRRQAAIRERLTAWFACPAQKHLRAACIRGHAFTDANVYRAKNGTRHCIECRRVFDRKRRPRGGVRNVACHAA